MLLRPFACSFVDDKPGNTFFVKSGNYCYTPRKFARVYSDPYVRPFVRLFVRSSVPISNPLLLVDR